MSRVIRTLLTACIVVAVVASIELLPRLWAEHSIQGAVNDAAHQRAREVTAQVAQDALKDAARDAVKRAAAQVQVDLEKQQAPATQPAAPIAPQSVERVAFRMTLPGDATFDPPLPGVDLDRLTEINLAGGGVITIIATDDKSQGELSYDRIVSRVQTKLTNIATATSTTFDSIKTARTTSFTGIVEGVRGNYEVAQCDGPSKSCVILIAGSDTNRPHFIDSARTAVATFEMKD